MIRNPRDMLEMGCVTGLIDEDVQVQQHGIDLTVGKLLAFDGRGSIDFSNEMRELPRTTRNLLEEYMTMYLDETPSAHLVQYNETVKVPEGMAAMVMCRSSLMRMGCFLHTCLYDAGYEGKGVGLLVNYRPVKIERNARVGQIIFFDADNEGKYDGVYQKEGVNSFNGPHMPNFQIG